MGPLPSSVALAWIDNSRRLLGCVRDATVPLAIDRNEHLIDLCDSLLDVWEAHAHRDGTFDWSADVDVMQLTGIVRQWIEIGRLTDDELAALGCSWAPPEATAFSTALEAGVVGALAAAGDEAVPLLDRLRPATDP